MRDIRRFLLRGFAERDCASEYDTITVGETPFTHDTKILSQYRHVTAVSHPSASLTQVAQPA